MADDRQSSRDARQEQRRRQRLQSPSDPGATHLPPPHSPGTHPSGELLSTIWPELETDLRRTLRRWVRPADVDDAVQEVFIRLERRLRRRPVDSDALRDLARLAATNLGKNAVRDARRRARLVERVAATEAQVTRSAVSAEHEADARIRLETVMRAITDLSDVDRRVIARALSSETFPSDKRERDRMFLQLFRARSRLRAKIADVFAGVPAWRLRSWCGEAAQVIGSAGTAAVVTALGSFIQSEPMPVPIPVRTDAVVARVVTPMSDVPAVGDALPPTRRPPSVGVVRTTAIVSLRSPAAEPPERNELIAVPHPAGGDAATVNGSERRQRRSLACIGGGPIPEAVCVPHPLRG